MTIGDKYVLSLFLSLPCHTFCNIYNCLAMFVIGRIIIARSWQTKAYATQMRYRVLRSFITWFVINELSMRPCTMAEGIRSRVE